MKSATFDIDVNAMYPTLMKIDYNNTWIGGTPDINPRYWPHQHLVDWSKAHVVERWCHANFKGRNWKSVGNKFAFKRGQDATLFMLKWS